MYENSNSRRIEEISVDENRRQLDAKIAAYATYRGGRE